MLLLALKASKAVIYDMNPQTGQVYSMEGLNWLLGYDKTEIEMDINWWNKQIHPEDFLRFQELLKNKIDQIGDRKIEYRVRAKDGSWLVVEDQSTVLPDEFGKPVRIVGTIIDMTERREAEDDLREGEERFRLVAEAAGVLVYEVNCENDNVLIFRGEEVLGYKPGEITATNKWWLTQLHPEDREPAMSQVESAIKKGVDCLLEYRIRCKQGNYIVVHDMLKMIKNEKGQVIRIVGGLRDVTERKKIEQALKESEQLYKTLFENSEDGFQVVEVIYGDGGKVVDCRDVKFNPAFLKLTGLTADEVAAKRIKEYFPNVENYWFEIFDSVVKAGRAIRIEWYNKCPKRTFDIHYFPYAKDKVGALFRDITQRKRDEESLLKAKEQSDRERRRLETIVETSPSAIVIFDTEGNFTAANKHAKELYGFDVIGLDLSTNVEMVIPRKTNGSSYIFEDLPANRALRGEVIRNEELTLQRADGTRYPILASAAPVYDMEGNVVSAIVIFEDISSRKNLEKKLEEQQRLAAIGATAGMVGHDIRNPLQAMMSDIYLLKGELSSIPECGTDTIIESIDGLEKNIVYINKIVADLQDYARPLNPEIIEVNLHNLVTKVFAPIVVPDNVSSHIQIDNSLSFSSDPTLLQRVLTNLVTNAIQAMPNGGDLRVTASRNKDKLLITVEDTGVGIPDRIKPKLFTPMITSKSKGQGLGLAVVKRLVEGLGGAVSFESQEGKGTKFTITLSQYLKKSSNSAF